MAIRKAKQPEAPGPNVHYGGKVRAQYCAERNQVKFVFGWDGGEAGEWGATLKPMRISPACSFPVTFTLSEAEARALAEDLQRGGYFPKAHERPMRLVLPDNCKAVAMGDRLIVDAPHPDAGELISDIPQSEKLAIQALNGMMTRSQAIREFARKTGEDPEAFLERLTSELREEVKRLAAQAGHDNHPEGGKTSGKEEAPQEAQSEEGEDWREAQARRERETPAEEEGGEEEEDQAPRVEEGEAPDFEERH